MLIIHLFWKNILELYPQVADWEFWKLDQVKTVKRISKVLPVVVISDVKVEDPNIAARQMLWTDPEVRKNLSWLGWDYKLNF